MSDSQSLEVDDSLERARRYKAIFEDDARGAVIFEELVRLFSKPAHLDGGIDAVIKTYHSMGQRSVVQHIINQINRAHGVGEE